MNQYYTCLNFIRDSIKGAPFVNTITQRTDIIDNVKKNIFPLAHINILNASAPSQSNTFTFEIAVLDIRNVSKVKSNDKFLGNDNEIDNLNTCHAIINYALTKMQLERNEFDIEIESVSDLTPILLEFTNMLDGWKVEITLSIPNNLMSVCCED
jgi:hypothetical protein